MRTSTLGEIAETVMGQAPPGKDCNKDGKGTIFVKAGEFHERFPVVREWTTKPLRLAKCSDVLVCVVGATAGKVNQGIDCAIGRSVAAVRPRNGTLDTGYLYYFLSQQTGLLRAKSQGLAQGVITRDMLHELHIPLPSLGQQKRIAAILDQADTLRRLHQRVTDHLNELEQSIFIEMFEDTASSTELGTLIARIEAGKNLVADDASLVGGYRVLKISAIGRTGFNPAETKPLPPGYVPPKAHLVSKGDLLFSRANTAELVGLAAIVDGVEPGTALPDKLWRLTPSASRATARFLEQLFRQPLVRLQLQQICSGTSGSMKNISMKKLASIKVPCPPLHLQQEFAKRIGVLNVLRHNTKKQTLGFQRLFASLEHRAFRGEL